MKKLCAILIAVLLTATFCSCRKVHGDGSNNSSDSAPLFSSEISSIEEQPEEPEISQPEPSAPSAPVEQPVTPTPQPTAPQEPTPQGKPADFVPKRFPIAPGSTETALVYYNCVFYRGTEYAYTWDGVSRSAIITIDDNDEYLDFIRYLDFGQDKAFTIYNDRIYLAKYPTVNNNYDKETQILNSFEIWSMNLQGGDKRQEKVITLSFTHIKHIDFISNSNYWFFEISNVCQNTRNIYRYNVLTKEFVKLNKEGFDDRFYLKNNRIFVFDEIGHKIYEYDINYENQRLFFDTSVLPKGDIYFDDLPNGFVLEIENKDKKYLLDMNGNVSELG